jgi:hypothetical protein
MYAIKNKDLDVILTMPAGIVSCDGLEEAKELLLLCHNYVDSLGLDSHNFVIIDLDTEEEIG